MSVRRITIFDTTLRDGEQSPGIALAPDEKAEIAAQLERLGVDVIEAGFAVSSPGDFEGVKAVAAAVERPTVASLGPHAQAGRRRLGRGARRRAPLAAPRLHRDEPDPHGEEASARAGRGGRAGPLGGRLRRRPGRRSRVLVRGRDAQRPAVRRPDLPRGDRGRRDHDQPPRHRRLLPARGARRVPPRGAAPLSRARARSASRSTATTTWGSPSRTRSRASRPGRRRSSAPSTGSASGPATRRSRRS